MGEERGRGEGRRKCKCPQISFLNQFIYNLLGFGGLCPRVSKYPTEKLVFVSSSCNCLEFNYTKEIKADKQFSYFAIVL